MIFQKQLRTTLLRPQNSERSNFYFAFEFFLQRIVMEVDKTS